MLMVDKIFLEMTNKNDLSYYYFEADKEGDVVNGMKTMKTIFNNIWKDNKIGSGFVYNKKIKYTIRKKGRGLRLCLKNLATFTVCFEEK